MNQPYDARKKFNRRASLGLGLGFVAGMATLGGLEMMGVGFKAPKRRPPTLATIKAQKPAFVAKHQPPLKDWPSLDRLAQGMVDARFTPGMSVSVMRGGVFLYSRGFGLADIESGKATDAHSSFRVASITKQFTAAAILLLAEQDKLKIDDRLAKFLPEFPRAAEMSLRQLMTHTSGLGDYINGSSHAFLEAAQHRDYSQADLLAALQAPSPLFRSDPGTAWAYSNSGFALLGIVAERLTGLNLPQIFEEWLFKPAGMADTAIDRSCTIVAGCSGYRPGGRGGFSRSLPPSPSFIGGAGAIRSTTQDLCRWHDALLSGCILNWASLNAMVTPARFNNGQVAWEQGAHERLLYGFGQGLGMLGAQPIIAHGGRLNGFTGQLRSAALEKVTVACLYNCDGTGIGEYLESERAVRVEALRLGLAAQV